MAITVKTRVYNKGTGTRSILAARSKVVKLRAGESVVLDYDLWSYLSPVLKRKLDQDIARGVIEVTTHVVTEGANLTVNQNGTIEWSRTALEANSVVVQKAKLPQPKDDHTTVLTPEAGTVATRSTSAMEEKLGVKASTVGETVEKDTEAQNTKAGFKMENASSSLFQRNRSQSPTQVDNLIGNKTLVSAESAVIETTQAPKQIPAAEAETPAEAETNEEYERAVERLEKDSKLSNSEYIDELYKAKDYATIATSLATWYPSYTFSKAAIKKCTSFNKLKEKYPILT